jgi:glycosyltransferase involved in cell wall biosynthesis
MIKLFINGIAASAGGGLTYLRNVVPHLSRRKDAKTTVLLSHSMRAELGELPNITFIESADGQGTFRRFLGEQTALPKLISSTGAQVLISTGNFALWKSPIPQILLSRNSLYTSADFLRDVRSRRDYTILVDTLLKGWLARQSIRRAEVTIAPSEAFAKDLSQWSGKTVRAVHHGFDSESFAGDATPLPPVVQVQLEQAGDSLRLLFVSHYNYYRNFETLFGAMPILATRLNRKVKLFLTCQLKSTKNPGTYRTESAAALAHELRERGDIVELGTIPYRSLHHLYRACHIYVTPAYAESFAHPLIEAMSSGLPVVASDLPVHREICGDAAIYFPPFSADVLAERILEIKDSHELKANLSHNGLRRSRDFSWKKHVEQLVDIAQELVQSKNGRS